MKKSGMDGWLPKGVKLTKNRILKSHIEEDRCADTKRTLTFEFTMPDFDRTEF